MSEERNKFNLSAKQEMFCRKYVELRNGTKAAIEAGYAENSARIEASRLLTNDNIKAKIAEIKAEWLENADITIEQLINEAKSIAFQDIVRDVLSCAEENQLKLPFDDIFVRNLNQLPEKVTRAISGVERTRYGVNIKTHDKISAMKFLADLLGFSKANTLDLNISLGEDISKARERILINNNNNEPATV